MPRKIIGARRPEAWGSYTPKPDEVLVVYGPAVDGGGKSVEAVSLKDLKPKIRKEVQKLLDKNTPSMVECTPVKVVRGVTPHFWKDGVSNHVVPRGAAPDDYDPPTITYRGSPEKFRDEVQKAYDNHPDPAFRGKVDFTNT